MEQSKSTRRDRIYIDEDKHQIYKDLTEGQNASFKTMKDAFMLAACIGYQRDRKMPLKKRVSIFPWTVFSAQEDIPVLRALAITETGDVEVLLDQDRLLMIMEEYANVGIDEIQRNVLELPGIAIENLVNFLI